MAKRTEIYSLHKSTPVVKEHAWFHTGYTIIFWGCGTTFFQSTFMSMTCDNCHSDGLKPQDVEKAGFQSLRYILMFSCAQLLHDVSEVKSVHATYV